MSTIGELKSFTKGLAFLLSVLCMFLFLGNLCNRALNEEYKSVVFAMIRLVMLIFGIKFAFRVICWYDNRVPVYLVIYIIAVFYHFYIYVTHGFPLIINSKILSDIHTRRVWAVLVISLISWISLCIKSPGQVTQRNVKCEMVRYPLTKIFPGGRVCNVCTTSKPARSKHCEWCNACILKWEQHCGWVNRCVGLENHGFYVNFLFVHGSSCLYLSYLLFELGREIVDHENFEQNTCIDSGCEQPNALTSYMRILRYFFIHHQQLLSIFLSLLVLGGTVLKRWVWHLYLIASNQTSVERRDAKIFKHMTSSLPGVEVYNRGIFRNILEGYFGYQKVYSEKRE